MTGFLTEAEWQALGLSLKVAGTAVSFDLPIAFLCALLLARRNFPGKPLVDSIIYLPLVLPPVAVGYLLLITFGTRTPIGGWLLDTFGLRFVFDWKGAVMAAAMLSFPFQVRAIRLSLESEDPGLGQAAETLGAGPLDRLFSIHLPLALPGILTGLVTAYAACLGEFGAIITFVSNIPGETRTLPLAIYTALQSPGGEQAAARLATLSITLALIGLVLADWVSRKARILVGQTPAS
jgi:molybdate transport system permease protein